MRWHTLICGLMLSGLAFGALAADLSDNAASCTSQNAKPASVRAILRDNQYYIGKCVRVRGLVAFRGLYDGTKSLYPGGKRDLPSPGYVAVYGSKSVSRDQLWSYRSFAEVTGTISSCDSIDTGPSEPNVIVMVVGQCHYHSGPLIIVTSITLVPNIGTRLIGELARREYGDLSQLRSDQVAPETREKTEQWFIAVQSRDFHRVKDVLGWTFNDRDGEIRTLIDPVKSPYRTIFSVTGLPKINYLRTSQRDGDIGSTYGCICKTADCTYEWPISRSDADDREEWPYFCIETFGRGGIEF
jgi:hypothetical protein